jgi:hypothetical protein
MDPRTKNSSFPGFKNGIFLAHVFIPNSHQIGHSRGFKVAILALFLTDFWTLNSGLHRIDHGTHIITNMSQFEGWRKVEDGAVDAAVTVCLSSQIHPYILLIFGV